MPTTLVLIKPDALERGLVGTLLARFEAAGLRVENCRSVCPDQAHMETHYADLKVRNARAFARTVKSLANRPFIAVRLSGTGAIQKVRALVGPTDPLMAPPGTIRGDFGNDSLAVADAEDRATNNLVHAADSEAAVARETALWFGETPTASAAERPGS